MRTSLKQLVDLRAVCMRRAPTATNGSAPWKAVIEACYQKKYADVLLERAGFEAQGLRYVIGFNFLELKLISDALAGRCGLAEYAWIPRRMPPEAHQQWLMDNFIARGAGWEVRLPNAITKKVRRTRAGWARFCRLGECRDAAAAMQRFELPRKQEGPREILAGAAPDAGGPALAGDTYEDIQQALARAIDHWIPLYDAVSGREREQAEFPDARAAESDWQSPLSSARDDITLRCGLERRQFSRDGLIPAYP